MSTQTPVGADRNRTIGPHFTFSARIAKTPRSFIREILKVTAFPGIISFAGGLPNPAFIDVDGIRKAAETVLERVFINVLDF